MAFVQGSLPAVSQAETECSTLVLLGSWCVEFTRNEYRLIRAPSMQLNEGSACDNPQLITSRIGSMAAYYIGELRLNQQAPSPKPDPSSQTTHLNGVRGSSFVFIPGRLVRIVSHGLSCMLSPLPARQNINASSYLTSGKTSPLPTSPSTVLRWMSWNMK